VLAEQNISLSVFKATVGDLQRPLSALKSDLRYGPYAKTKFGMLIPEVEKILKDQNIQSVVLFGVEVGLSAYSSIRLD
jgi:hypothetical protein